MTTRADSIAYPPRGLTRDEAARYIGVGPTKFDEMVADRRMPKPKRVDGRTVWDRVQLDIAFNALPDEDEGGLQAMIEASKRKVRSEQH